MRLPNTLLVSAVCALIYVFLSLRVILVRFRSEKLAVGALVDDKLQIRIRVHGNFVEYVPFALLLMGFLEISGANPHYLLAIASTSCPLPSRYPLRAFGILGTLGVLVAESVYALMLR